MELQIERTNAEIGVVNSWLPPSENIQKLFEAAVAPGQKKQEEEEHVVLKDAEKLPSTLTKLIKNFDAIRADLEIQKREILRVNNEMKHTQNLLLRYAKTCLKQKESETASAAEKGKSSARGFAKPTKVSAELCEFLGVPIGTLVSRTETIVYINKYIKDRELQDPSNLRNIILDDKLTKLFGGGGDAALIDKISFFKMQKYLSQHFKKSVVGKQDEIDTDVQVFANA